MNTEPQSLEIETPADGGVQDVTPETMDVAKQTMVGDMRDVCLQIIKDPKLTGKAWKDMNEAEQRDVAQMITDRMTDSVVNACQIIASNGSRQLMATLEQVVIKDGVKAVLKCFKHSELFHDLCDAEGEAVGIVLTGAQDFVGVGAAPQIDKDQADLVEELEQQEGSIDDNEPETTEENIETQLDAESDDLT